MGMPRRECGFYDSCETYWGIDRPVYIVEPLEFWRMAVGDGELSWTCGASTECEGATFTNCCQNDYDKDPVCARVDSAHCEGGRCVPGEKFCEKLKDGKRCIPDEFSCPIESMAIWQPILMLLAIACLSIGECLSSYHKKCQDEKKRK